MWVRPRETMIECFNITEVKRKRLFYMRAHCKLQAATKEHISGAVARTYR